jgi:aryl-alcohol dehydrogenase-like predicted oxidoreductase
MKRFRAPLALWLMSTALPAPAAGPLLAGAATTDVTPPTGHAMWGYAARHDAACVGVLDPLKARALVLSVGDERLALVSLDLGRAPTRASMAAIRKRVHDEAGVDTLFLAASHTHHGPILEVDDWPSPDKSYRAALEDKLCAVVVAAAKASRPARIGVGSRESALNRNRHSKRDDKPVDRELLVLRVVDLDGKPIAHAVNFAAHPTMTDALVLKFSADWPGAMAAQVEKETGAPCLFLQGAAGDLSGAAPRGVAGPAAFGRAVAQEALALAATIRPEPLEKTTLAVAEDDFTFAARLDLQNPAVAGALGLVFFPDLITFYEREYRDGVRPHLTTALLDGRIGFVGVSGEFFCGHSLALKRRARLPHLFFVGYCNDYQQYFPTIEAASEGGYGTAAPVSPAETGAVGERGEVGTVKGFLEKAAGAFSGVRSDQGDGMDYTTLGNTGLLVSKLCFGTMTFGDGRGLFKMIGAQGQAEADALVKASIERGVNFFDTADVYTEGESEKILGQALKNLDVARKDVVIATKVFGRVGPGRNDVGASRGHILDGVDASLRRLQTDHIDLYQIHATDSVTPVEETLRALDDLVRHGKVRYIGCSNWQAWKLAKALGISEFKNLARFDTLQAYYSIAGRDLERELVPLLEAEKVGLLVWSPLAGGLLSGKFSRNNQKPADSRRSEFDFPLVDKERTWKILDVIAPIAQAHGCSAARIALAWLLAKPVVTSVIIGAKRLDQLNDNLAAVDLKLTPDEMQRLDEVSTLPAEYPGWMIPVQGADRTDPSKARFGRR